jgi:hypothetical protein
MDAAMDSLTEGVAHRAGVSRTRAVSRKTLLMIVRFRYQVTTILQDQEKAGLAEECRILACSGSAGDPTWLTDDEAEGLLETLPDRNVPSDQAGHVLASALDDLPALLPHIRGMAALRAGLLKESHQRVRKVAGLRNVRYEVEHQEPDILGLYVYLPMTEAE